MRGLCSSLWIILGTISHCGSLTGVVFWSPNLSDITDTRNDCTSDVLRGFTAELFHYWSMHKPSQFVASQDDFNWATEATGCNFRWILKAPLFCLMPSLNGNKKQKKKKMADAILASLIAFFWPEPPEVRQYDLDDR